MDWKAMLNIGENSEINKRDSLGDLGEAWPCRGRKITSGDYILSQHSRRHLLSLKRQAHVFNVPDLPNGCLCVQGPLTLSITYVLGAPVNHRRASGP